MKVRFSNHATIGRFLRSLYVGRITEYLFWEDLAIVRVGGSNSGRENETADSRKTGSSFGGTWR